MRLIYHSIFCMIVFITFHERLHAQFRIQSYGITIANSTNGISVGYQDFESIGMKTNFISKGQPEFSVINPMIGISLIAEYEPIFLMGRMSFDDRSGIIEDENVPGSLVMQPNLSYLTLESALILKPWDIFSLYGGPSLSMLLQHSIGKLGENDYANSLSNMNTLIPGIFAGISAEFTTNHEIFDTPLHFSPFLETSLIFNQRRGEYPENQDGFDNIWSTFSMRAGISIHVNATKESPQVDIPFVLQIPKEMAGKRAMQEHHPLVMEWKIPTFHRLLKTAQASPRSFHQSPKMLCSKSDSMFQHDDVKRQRICIEERSMLLLMHHLMESSDTCLFTICAIESFRDIQSELKAIAKQIMVIDSSRIQFDKCALNHAHSESIKANFVSGHIPIIEMNFPSISPPENVIICSLITPDIPKEWFIDITGPQEYTKMFGPFTNQSVHLDGSELLQGEAGAGAYQWTIRYADEEGKTRSFSKDFRIQISSENKLQGHSFTYLPIIHSDSLLKSQIAQDLSDHLRSSDEILLIIDEKATEEMRHITRDILEFINTIIRKLDRNVRKEISIIEKGRENALYDSASDWGKIYEQGIRMEIIH